MSLFTEMYQKGIVETKTYSQIMKAIIAAIKKDKKSLVKEADFGTYTPPDKKLHNWDLLRLVGIFKQHFGKEGSIFDVKAGDGTPLEPGSYKIIRYEPEGSSFIVKLKKLGGRILDKRLKINLSIFLNKARIYA